jgi:membrane-associated phospholipid phosphatase
MTAHASGGTVVWRHAEVRWFLDVNHLARTSGWLHTPMRIYAQLGIVLFAAALVLSWWLARRNGAVEQVAAALWAPIGVLLAVGLNQFIAAAVAEPRPYAVLPHALVLVPRSSDSSFPSDHAVMAGAVAVGV